MVSANFAADFPILSNRNQPVYPTQYMQRNQIISKEIGEMKSTRIHAYKRRCECFDLHKYYVPYKHAWSWQKSVVDKRHCLINRGEDHSDTLIVLQHPPVYTLGTGSSDKFLNFDIENAPYDIYRTERGGEVTYHGPGQLVMYPIINLRYHKQDLNWYLRSLEEVVIRALWSAFSIKATQIDGLTGVWETKRLLQLE